MNGPHFILFQVEMKRLHEAGVKPGPIYLTNLEPLKKAGAAIGHSGYFVEVSAVVAEEFEFDKFHTINGFALTICLAGKPLSKLRANLRLTHALSSPMRCPGRAFDFSCLNSRIQLLEYNHTILRASSMP